MIRQTPLKQLANFSENNDLTDLHIPTINDDNAEGVMGLTGRIRLQKNQNQATGVWIEKQRANLVAYEYLCHIGEAKEWVEACLNESIPAVSMLEESLRDGVVLAKLSNVFYPGTAPKIFQGSKLQFRHSDNINYFFNALERSELPKIFWFELTDLYDKKNIPKVIYCIHALSHLLSHKGLAPSLKNLVGQLEFTTEELSATQKSLKATGNAMPNFSALRQQLNESEDPGCQTPELIPDSAETKWNQYWMDSTHQQQLVQCQRQVRQWLAARKEKRDKQRQKQEQWLAFPRQALHAHCVGFLGRRRFKAKVAHRRLASYWVTPFQACCRTYLVKRQLQSLRNYYLQNMDAIIRMQRYIRHQLTDKKYNDLVLGSNPSLKTVKSFVHLLDDSELDFDNDLALDELRQKITNQIKENNRMELFINTLDIQIALFLRNAITMEELMKHSGAARRRRQRALKQKALDGPPKSDRFSLSGMDKSSRQRLDYYQQLIYLLQTEPKYLARLLAAVTNHQVLGRWSNMEFLESTVLSLFSYATNAREEYLLIKLCQHCIKEEVKNLREPEEFLQGNYSFMKLIVQTNRGAKEREFFKELVQPLVNLVISNPDLDLETNPTIIYQKIISEEELQTGIPTQRPYQVTAQTALADHIVRERFIVHLRELRRIVNQFLTAITSLREKMPYGIRCIARELRLQLEESYPSIAQEQIIKIIGHFIYYRYLNPAFVAPEQYDVVDTVINPMQRKNLVEVSKMLQYISSGKSFTEADHFLSPLKEYVQESSALFAQWFVEVTEVQSPEDYFGMDLWTDRTTTHKPVVYMIPEELFHLHYVLEQNIQSLEPGASDKIMFHQEGGIPLFDLLNALGMSGYDANVMFSKDMTVRLRLSSFQDGLPMDAASWLRQFLFDAKRLVVYVIKHQSGPTLLDILKSPVSMREEQAWQIFKQAEFKAENDLAPKRRWLSLGTSEEPLDLADLTLTQLKKLAFRLVLHLERCQVISEGGGYQDLINMIAHDITGKHTRRKQRSKEMKRMKKMLKHLGAKGKYLTDQAGKYEDYLSGCMKSMANKTWRSKKPKAALFTRQYYHLRGISKAGLPVPRFGTYCYTAKQMHDRKILVDLKYAGVKRSQYEKIAMVFSMAEPGIITVEASYQGWKHVPQEERHVMDTVAKTLQNATVIRLDLHYEDLLQSQFEGVYIIALIDGAVKVNLNLLIYFINKKFYS